MRSDESDLLTSIDICGRSSPPDAIDYLAKYADHPSARVRSWTVEALNRLDTADADQWIVAIGVREHDEVARLTVCRAAEQASLLALAPTLAAWVRDETASDILRRDAALALGHMQATRELSGLNESRIPDSLREWIADILQSAAAGRSSRDHTKRLPAPFHPQPLSELPRWRIWHEDGTLTEVLDDGSAVGPDFRRPRSLPALPWWPSGVDRRARLPLRAEIVRLYNTDPELAEAAFLSALKTETAPSILGWGWGSLFPTLTMDEALPVLKPLLDSEDPWIRGAAWRQAATTYLEQLWMDAAQRLANEKEPAVRHMLLRVLHGRNETLARDAISASMAADDHTERAVAVHAAIGAPDASSHLRLASIAASDQSPLVRAVAQRALTFLAGS